MMPQELISQTITDWITGLNYQYMAVVVIICYGIKWKDNMKWISSRIGGETRTKWMVGILVALTEVISTFEFLGGHGVDLNTFILLFHSYLIVMIFCDDIVNKLHDWIVFMTKKGDKNNQSPQS
jgi:type IV secretory pathway VirB2 component (pilin)